MSKKLTIFMAATVMMFGILVLAGCGNEEVPMGKFYTLQKAYSDGLVTASYVASHTIKVVATMNPT